MPKLMESSMEELDRPASNDTLGFDVARYEVFTINQLDVPN
jgi:hypothetical protein